MGIGELVLLHHALDVARDGAIEEGQRVMGESRDCTQTERNRGNDQTRTSVS